MFDWLKPSFWRERRRQREEMILFLLAKNGEMCGRDIRQESKGLCTRVNIYTTLADLERRGGIKSRVIDTHIISGMSLDRRGYSLSEIWRNESRSSGRERAVVQRLKCFT